MRRIIFSISLAFSGNNWESYPSKFQQYRVICRISRGSDELTTMALLCFVWGGEVDAELFHHPMKTLGHHPCLFIPPPHPKDRGDKRVWQILPIISCRVLCFLYSMNPCVTLCQQQIVCSCHHVVICVTMP